MYGSEQIPDLTQWQDYGMGGYDDDSNEEPEDWRLHGLPDYGAYSEQMGILTCEGLSGMAVEVTPQLYGNQLLARTPLLELTPEDYKYVSVMKAPYAGMMGLGDDGAIYEFDGSLGFFKRLFKGIKKVARKVRKAVRRVIKKIPGGKYLIKLGKKIWKIAKKFVRPLAKFVGKYASKLAPIAALIPGYGPAIAAGLYTAGKIAKIMLKVGATVKAVRGGNISKLVFPSGSKAKKFQKILKKAARGEKKRQRRGGKIKPISAMRGRSRSRGRSRRRGRSRFRSRGLRSVMSRMRSQMSRMGRRRGGSSRRRRSSRSRRW